MNEATEKYISLLNSLRLDFKKGDLKKLVDRLNTSEGSDKQEAKYALIMHYSSFVVHYAKNFSKMTGLDIDDLISEGNQELCNILNRKNVDASHICSRLITGLKYRFSKYALSHKPSLPLGEMQDKEYPPCFESDRKHYEEQLSTLIDFLLPEFEKNLVISHFGLDGSFGKSLADIGREQGYTRERIRQIKNKALSRLKIRIPNDQLEMLREQFYQ